MSAAGVPRPVDPPVTKPPPRPLAAGTMFVGLLAAFANGEASATAPPKSWHFFAPGATRPAY